MPKRSSNHSRYSIVRKLGSGGAGSVYLARDLLDDGQKVALKVFRAEIAPEEILREFRILRGLRHLGIARAYDFGRLPDTGQTYFTMEYVAGPNLERESARLRRQVGQGSLTPLLDVFLQVVAALGYLHSKGLLHLDLKPSNVVFSDGRAKLIDFGLFQNAHQQDSSRVRGTAYYIAPEMFAGRPLDCRADLYSLGVTLYRSFTGRYPITGSSLPAIADNPRRTVPPLPGGLPEELSKIIMKLLAKSPGRRFQTADEVEKALRALYPKSTTPPHKIPFHDPEFVGRKVELDGFFTWLEGLDKASGARTLVVEGEPGIGKSRFVEACITEMVSGSVGVLSVPGYAVKNQNGMGAVLKRWFAVYGLPREHKLRYSFLLTSVGIASHAASLREIKQMDLEQIRARVFQEALQLFGGLARTRVVMVIEDLHNADSQLLDFVRRFTEREPASDVAGRLGLVVSCRPGKEAVRQLGLEQARVIECGPLKREEIKRSLEGILPVVGARTVSHLARTCRGNPGVLVQLIHQVLSSEEHGLPADFADLRVLMEERLRGLKKPERLLILFLGLLDLQPTSGTFLRDLTGLSSATFGGARKSLTEAGLLRGDSRGYFLVPDFLGELTVRGYDAKALREAHEKIGSRLLKNRKTQREAAKHLLLGGRTQEGLLSARKAGKELRDAGRVEEALCLYREAIEYAPEADGQAYFLEELGDLLEKSGQFDQAASAYDRVINGPDLSDSARLRVLRKLGGIFQRSGRNEEARRAFDEALQLLEKVDNVEEHLYLLNELAALHLFRGEFSQSTTFANRGLEILGSPVAEQLSPESRALHDLNLRSVAGHILLRQFEYRRAADELQRSLKTSERIGTLSNTALILNNLGVTYYQSNRLKEALGIYRRAAELARKMGDETALFSIQCNVAGVRSRLGEIHAAEEMLDAIEEMPHTHRSKRAHLLLLHSRGLLARLTLGDARVIWQESVQLADELPDPLIASYGRIYLFENEIFQGRWHSARKVLKEIEGIESKKAERRDTRMERAIAIRRAYLEALCGNKEEARSQLSHLTLYDSALKKNGQTNDYGDLWDRVLVASTLMEIGKFADAEQWLKGAKVGFVRLRQHPGTLECSLLRAQVALRSGHPDKAEKRLKEARRALSLHDTSRGSRAAAVRIPFLEAHLGMQTSRTHRTYVSARLVDAARNLPFGARWELAWLLDLVAKEHGEAGSQQRVSSSKARFLRGLSREDRKSYLARDHRLRLGLGGVETSDQSEEDTGGGFFQEHVRETVPAPERVPREKTALLVEDGERTRTFVAATFVESESPRMREVLTMIRRTKDSRLPVLLTGESGTGKDLLARWIHSLSPCKENPFLLLDCSAIPEGLLEAELFGHEAGAFTGAEQRTQGCLLSAQGGTVYLDHVDSISLASQAKLLRVLEEKAIRPVGGDTPVKIDLRFIASTQRDLKDLCNRGEFRNDFYFRLSGICLVVPPLREYVEDIPQLLKHFQRQLSCGKLEFTRPALEVLRSHPWPGNVRELESVVHRLALTCDGVVGESEILHALGVDEAPRAFPRWIFQGRSYSQALREVKREYLLHLFELHKGDIDRIARELQTTKRNVYQRFIQVGLHAGDLRAGVHRES